MTNHHVRFAPSPTGDLHLGHLYSALYGWRAANQNPDQFQLRIDDLDHTRCRAHFVSRHCDDLNWLGITWTKAPLYQSQRLHRYQSALAFLQERQWVYPCFLSRREVDEILSAPQQQGGLLRGALSDGEINDRIQDGTEPAWRLDMAKIKAHGSGRPPALSWFDMQKGQQQLSWEALDDKIIARRDIGTSYDLSVVLDDYDSGVTLVTRGADLFDQTHTHRLLQHLLNLPTPLYDHHPLITDEAGKRLAKRDDARSLASYRAQGMEAADIIALLPF